MVPERGQTRRTETSKYPEEEKTIVIPIVAASEIGLAKAKYSWETDSEPVPWGKGEKNPEQGSETEPETIRLQAVGADLIRDGVPFA